MALVACTPDVDLLPGEEETSEDSPDDTDGMSSAGNPTTGSVQTVSGEPDSSESSSDGSSSYGEEDSSSSTGEPMDETTDSDSSESSGTSTTDSTTTDSTATEDTSTSSGGGLDCHSLEEVYASPEALEAKCEAHPWKMPECMPSPPFLTCQDVIAGLVGNPACDDVDLCDYIACADALQQNACGSWPVECDEIRLCMESSPVEG